jgi:hypothetical protein
MGKKDVILELSIIAFTIMCRDFRNRNTDDKRPDGFQFLKSRTSNRITDFLHMTKLLFMKLKFTNMIVPYMITCFGTTFETFTEIESLQGPTTLYGRLIIPL